jgi:hypothetical protein
MQQPEPSWPADYFLASAHSSSPIAHRQKNGLTFDEPNDVEKLTKHPAMALYA